MLAGRKWYKLVGESEPGNNVEDDWEHDDPSTFDAVYFPWNKFPYQVLIGDWLIVQAVHREFVGALMAVQQAVTTPDKNPRQGLPGSRTDRWPHMLKVETEAFCSPLRTAPRLSAVYPAFAAKYRSRFQHGSHWQITDDEFYVLRTIIHRAGRPYQVPAASAHPGPLV
jgi:hypothetical protein